MRRNASDTITTETLNMTQFLLEKTFVKSTPEFQTMKSLPNLHNKRRQCVKTDETDTSFVSRIYPLHKLISIRCM